LATCATQNPRTKTFNCSRCGSEAYFCVVEPMEDYRLDEVEEAAHHPKAIERFTGRRGSDRRVEHSGGELPGRKIDLRR